LYTFNIKFMTLKWFIYWQSVD